MVRVMQEQAPAPQPMVVPAPEAMVLVAQEPAQIPQPMVVPAPEAMVRVMQEQAPAPQPMVVPAPEAMVRVMQEQGPAPQPMVAPVSEDRRGIGDVFSEARRLIDRLLGGWLSPKEPISTEAIPADYQGPATMQRPAADTAAVLRSVAGLRQGIDAYSQAIHAAAGSLSQDVAMSAVQAAAPAADAGAANYFASSPAAAMGSTGAPSGGSSGGLSGAPVQAFARGGIVTRPTYAMLGEAGPEMVVPLSRAAAGRGFVLPSPQVNLHTMAPHIGAIHMQTNVTSPSPAYVAHTTGRSQRRMAQSLGRQILRAARSEGA
jgi:hypothetical protein